MQIKSTLQLQYAAQANKIILMKNESTSHIRILRHNKKQPAELSQRRDSNNSPIVNRKSSMTVFEQSIINCYVAQSALRNHSNFSVNNESSPQHLQEKHILVHRHGDR